MTRRLSDLITEISVGVEIYFTGRTTQLYNNSAFILCDDYTELVSKLFLKSKDNQWTDDLGNGRFKDYKTVLNEVVTWHAANLPRKQGDVDRLVNAMKDRRESRNAFFHSTHLLGMTVQAGWCIDAFCGLMQYGELLFGRDWEETVKSVGNLETLHLLLRLEKAAASDRAMKPKFQRIMSRYETTIPKPQRNGSYQYILSDDYILLLTIVNGGDNLKLELKALLPP